MRESCTYGSARGVLSNEHPYRYEQSIQRRSFLTLLGGTAAAWPLAAKAQQAVMPVIGYLSLGLPDVYSERLRAFHHSLNEAGFVDGRNVAIVYRWAGDDIDQLPALAADLARRQVSVIAAFGGSYGSLAARAATTTIPVVFGGGEDPVATGLVASFNRPGGNMTGAITLSVEIVPKRLEIMHELAPTGTIAVLVNPTRPNVDFIAAGLQVAARALGRQIHVLRASNEGEIDGAFASLVQMRATGLVIGTDAYFNSRAKQFGALTLRYAVPTIYQYREFVAAGGLMSYGSAITEVYRIAGSYVGRILKGEKPADLPVQQATRIELIINMITAKALGITFPTALLVRADEVIE
jgi:putative ABC transport system substrate-binding protein